MASAAAPGGEVSFCLTQQTFFQFAFRVERPADTAGGRTQDQGTSHMPPPRGRDAFPERETLRSPPPFPGLGPRCWPDATPGRDEPPDPGRDARARRQPGPCGSPAGPPRLWATRGGRRETPRAGGSLRPGSGPCGTRDRRMGRRGRAADPKAADRITRRAPAYLSSNRCSNNLFKSTKTTWRISYACGGNEGIKQCSGSPWG